MRPALAGYRDGRDNNDHTDSSTLDARPRCRLCTLCCLCTLYNPLFSTPHTAPTLAGYKNVTRKNKWVPMGFYDSDNAAHFGLILFP